MRSTSCSERSPASARSVLGDKLDSQSITLPAELEKAVAVSLEAWRRDGNVRRLWARDASLWTGADEAKWLGWLDIAREQSARVDFLLRLADDVARQGFSHAVLLGMGGSSLGPEVFGRDFWTSKRPSRAVGARLDGPRADPNDRKQDRSRANPLHRVEQIRQHARTEHPQAVFLRVREASGRRRRSGIAVHRHHRSRVEVADDRRARSIPPHRVRDPEHRRPLFRAVGFRPGARRRDGSGCRPAARRRAGDGALVRRPCAAGR